MSEKTEALLKEMPDKILSRLDALIALYVRKELEGKSTTSRDMISLLSTCGIDYKVIAKIFNKTPSYIASELTQIRKGGGKNAKRKQSGS